MAAETEIVSPSETLSQLEAEVIEIFVRAAQLIGLPKSYGEIYGLLFLSAEPLSMDQIMRRLSISLGSILERQGRVESQPNLKIVKMG